MIRTYNSVRALVVCSAVLAGLLSLAGCAKTRPGHRAPAVLGPTLMTVTDAAPGREPDALPPAGPSPHPGPRHPVLRWASNSGVFSGAPIVSPDGRVYVHSPGICITAFSSDGERLWGYDADIGLPGPPALAADGAVYTLDDLNRLHALAPDGALRWRLQFGQATFGDVTTWGPERNRAGFERQVFPAPDGGVVALCHDSMVRSVAESGELRWESEVAGDYGRLAVTGDGTVFVATQGKGGSLEAIAPSGERLWRIGRTEGFWVHPREDGGAFIRNSESQRSVDRAGNVTEDNTPVERLPPPMGMDGRGQGGAVVDSEGCTYVRTSRWVADGAANPMAQMIPGHYEGSLQATSPKGETLWEIPLAGSWMGTNEPAIGPDRTLYTLSSDGRLLCLGEGDEATATSGDLELPTPTLADVGYKECGRIALAGQVRNVSAQQLPSGRLVVFTQRSSASSDGGEMLLTHPDGQLIARKPLRSASRNGVTEAADGSLWVRFYDSLYHWSADLSRWREVTSEMVLERDRRPDARLSSGVALIAPDVAVAAFGRHGVAAVAPSGRVAWRRDGELAHDTSPVAASDGTLLIVPEERTTLLALDARGEELWRYRPGCEIRQPQVTEDGQVLVTDEDGVLHALTSGGEVLWTMRLRDGEHGSGSRVWIGDSGLVYAVCETRSGPAVLLTLKTAGRVLRRADVGASWGSAVAGETADGGLLVHAGRGKGGSDHLLCLGPDGAVRWSLPYHTHIRSALSVLSDGTIAAREGDELVLYEESGAEQDRGGTIGPANVTPGGEPTE